MAQGSGIARGKRSFVQTFLDEQVRITKKTKHGTRMELARAQNRKDKTYGNMHKAKERAAQALEKLREAEAAHEAACEEVKRLEAQLNEEMDVDLM